MGDIVGQDRTQSTLFPQALEEYIAAENPARFIDAFVEELDLAAGLYKGGRERDWAAGV